MRALLLPLSLVIGGLSCVDGGGQGDAGPCRATFRWLQKDAYAEEAGRTSPLWPPHTTTEITVSCDATEGSFADRGEMANHGTTVAARDPSGTPILVEVHKEVAFGSREDVEALLDAYASCDCDDALGTKFLSMDDLDASMVESILAKVADYAQQNLTCNGNPPTEVVAALRAGDADRAIDLYRTCSWRSGTSAEAAFEQGLQAVGGALDGYHVCNNDAQLQSLLWDQFKAGQPVTDCEPSAIQCKGPEFFYTP